MVINVEELEYIKSNWLARIKASVVSMQVGDDGSTPIESDTDIGNLLETASIEALDESINDKLSWTSKFGITAFIGDTIREVVLYDGTNGKARNLTVENVKSADEIFWVTGGVSITSANNGGA